ncbi:hypothetical protein TNCV_1860911 [Trichonephila clavipes]|nr:hypothetical protein TNCV_1860911 [Trichonephila clavipes]
MTTLDYCGRTVYTKSSEFDYRFSYTLTNTAYHEFKPITTEEPPCKGTMSRAQKSSHWCGVVVRKEGCQLRCPPRLDHGSKLRGPSPKSLE